MYLECSRKQLSILYTVIKSTIRTVKINRQLIIEILLLVGVLVNQAVVDNNGVKIYHLTISRCGSKYAGLKYSFRLVLPIARTVSGLSSLMSKVSMMETFSSGSRSIPESSLICMMSLWRFLWEPLLLCCCSLWIMGRTVKDVGVL